MEVCGKTITGLGPLTGPNNVNRLLFKVCKLFSLNIFYFQQIKSYTVQYIQFIRKLG